jgi:hypothetical protein
MTSDVRIDRLSARFRLAPAGRAVPVHQAGSAARLDGLLHRMVRDGLLERAFHAAPLPPGEWLVRRLDLVVHLDLDRPDSALAHAWARDVAAAAARTVAGGGGSGPQARDSDIVHYPCRRDAVVDLVTSVPLGRQERAWAWRRLGLLAPGAPASGPALPSAARPAAPGLPAAPASAGVLLGALSRQPGEAMGVLVTAVQRVGLPALDRALGEVGWTAVAGLAARAAGAPGWPPDSGPPTVASAVPPTAADGTAADGDEAALARVIVAASRMAAAVTRSRLRPTVRTLAAWACLAGLEADPLLPGHPRAARVIGEIAALLAGPPPAPAALPGHRAAGTPDGGGADRRSPSRHPHPSSPPHPRTSRDDAVPQAGPPAPAQPWEGARGVTDWAGLAFLLTTAVAAGVPGAASEPVFARRPLRWVLNALAVAIVPIGADDPAALALAGLTPADVPPLAVGPPATPDERRRIEDLARSWTAATASRLAAFRAAAFRPGGTRGGSACPDPAPAPAPDPVAAVARIAGRRGTVVADPGWIEIHLGLDQVDLDVRRAGLDVDPGWVPWLATVVRFRYG